MNTGIRLDRLVVLRGMAPSRMRAVEAIEGSGIRVDGAVVHRAAAQVAEDAALEWVEQPWSYVGRGALKLLAACERWPDHRWEGRRVLDVGASTGGFTQVVLERGAERVFAVDTGRDQLAQVLRDDARVVWREQTNVLDLVTEEVAQACGGSVDAAVVDVSFVGATHVLPAVGRLVVPGSEVWVLVKPQFEVGPQGLGRNGIVRDARRREAAVSRVEEVARQAGWEAVDRMESPVVGGDGNVEFWLRLRSPQTPCA
ncbi:MAG: hypothetical protein RLZZ275_386 [Bacteroidota bacterium]